MVSSGATLATGVGRQYLRSAAGPAPRLVDRESVHGGGMENLAELGIFLGGLGVFFVGLGVLWGVSEWRSSGR